MNDEIAKNLNELIQYLYDSHHGYIDCAENISSGKLKDLFFSLATQRQQMINEIKYELEKFNKSAANHGTVAGVLHRTFVNIKHLITKREIDSIIDEVKFGENFLIDTYNNILKNNNLSINLHHMLIAHLGNIENSLMKIDLESLNP
jgi:uncharacterized protein (TIGR02284 family)